MSYYTSAQRRGEPWAQPRPQYVAPKATVRKTKEHYQAEVTDTYGGEANYCWVRRYIVAASSPLGAIRKVSRAEGLSFRSVGCDRYDARHACICAFITHEADCGELRGVTL